MFMVTETRTINTSGFAQSILYSADHSW